VTGKQVLRVTANVNKNDRHWTAWVGPSLTKSVRSLAEALARADMHGYDLDVQPEAYEEMVSAGVAKPGATGESDWHDFAA